MAGNPVYSYHAEDCKAFSNILSSIIVRRLAEGMTADCQMMAELIQTAKEIESKLSSGETIVYLDDLELRFLKSIIKAISDFEKLTA